jgi:hypothetical protein
MFLTNQLNNSMNPSNIKTITKVLSIDTIFRSNSINTISTDHLFSLPEPINNVTSLRLSSMEFPNMWYSFSSERKSNIFEIYDNEQNKTVVEIPEGNYTAESFEEMMNNCLRSLKLNNIHCEINSRTTKTVFRNTNHFVDGVGAVSLDLDLDLGISANSFSLNFEVEGVPQNQTAGFMMGFKRSSYISTNVDYSIKYEDKYTYIDDDFIDDVIKSTSSSTSYLYVNGNNPVYYSYVDSESSFGSNTLQYILLDIDDFQRNITTNSYLHQIGDTYLGHNILAKIVVSSGHFTNIVDSGIDLMFKRRNYFGPVRLEKLHIRVLDKFGNVVNLNNNNFSMTLELEQMYSK